jgi:4-hydroxy-3-polyprenylbenzoate decarboxylase
MNVANKDLRDWISGIEAAGELKLIKGAEPKEEIGGFVDIYQRKMGNPALMFDEVPGFPKGHRVIANIRCRASTSPLDCLLKHPRWSSSNGGGTT